MCSYSKGKRRKNKKIRKCEKRLVGRRKNIRSTRREKGLVRRKNKKIRRSWKRLSRGKKVEEILYEMRSVLVGGGKKKGSLFGFNVIERKKVLCGGGISVSLRSFDCSLIL
mgnify:CR=1 FL=1